MVANTWLTRDSFQHFHWSLVNQIFFLVSCLFRSSSKASYQRFTFCSVSVSLGASVQRLHVVYVDKCAFPGPLSVWWESWEILFSQDAPGRLLVPSPVSTLQRVPAPALQIPHQEVQVCGADSFSPEPLLNRLHHCYAASADRKHSRYFRNTKLCNK